MTLCHCMLCNVHYKTHKVHNQLHISIRIGLDQYHIYPLGILSALAAVHYLLGGLAIREYLTNSRGAAAEPFPPLSFVPCIFLDQLRCRSLSLCFRVVHIYNEPARQ